MNTIYVVEVGTPRKGQTGSYSKYVKITDYDELQKWHDGSIDSIGKLALIREPKATIVFNVYRKL